MALDPNKFKRIVSGITTPADPGVPADDPAGVPDPAATAAAASDPGGDAPAPGVSDPPGQGRGEGVHAGHSPTPQPALKRFAKTGRPRGSRTAPAGKASKTKVTLFLDEQLVNELYEWAHQDRMHPGELFDRALRSYRDREVKRRNAGTA